MHRIHISILARVVMLAGLLALLAGCQSAQQKADEAAAAAGLTSDDLKAVYAAGLDLSAGLKSLNLTPQQVEILNRGISDGAAALAVKKADKSKADAPLPAPPADLTADADKTAYTRGVDAARSIEPLGLSAEELKIYEKAVADGAAGTPVIDLEQWRSKIGDFARARSTRAAEQNLAAAKAFLAEQAKLPGMQKTESGLLYRELKPGTGRAPFRTSRVRVSYVAKLADGTVVDSSAKNGKPSEFPVDGVIPCWTEGIRKTKVGGKIELTCPPDLAYGEGGSAPDIPPNAAMVFEIDLLAIL